MPSNQEDWVGGAPPTLLEAFPHLSWGRRWARGERGHMAEMYSIQWLRVVLMVSHKEAPDEQKINLIDWQMQDFNLHFKDKQIDSEVK